jgi:hypothetical protein
MDTIRLIRPLARWDGAHVVLDLEAVEGHLQRLIEDGDTIRDVNLSGAGDTLRIEADVTWKGLRARVAAELGELRLRHRRLGLRIRRIEVLGGFPLPRWAILRVLEARAGDRVVVRTDSRIVVIDLRSSIPDELELSVLTVQVTERTVDVWIGPGGLRDLPQRDPPRLAAVTGDRVGTSGSTDGASLDTDMGLS